MFGGLFAKKAPASQGPSGRVPGFPWAGAADEIAANLAMGDLVNNLPIKLTVGGRIHVETFLAAAGAIAGYAAQQALLADIGAGAGGLTTVTTQDGREFFFGDALNRALVAQSEAEAGEKLWPLAVGGAVAAGLDPARAPPLDAIFAHVSGALGGEGEGLSSLPDHQPQRPVGQVLRAVWPLALMCFAGQLSGRSLPQPMTVAQRWRPMIAARAAAAFIPQVKDVLAPADALTILMEAAVYASKLPPAAVAEGPDRT
jgi:hypothetical protein